MEPQTPQSGADLLLQTLDEGSSVKCKTAAKFRREKETEAINHLSRLLPMPAPIAMQLDKATVIRLTTSFLKLRNALHHFFGASSSSASDPFWHPSLAREHFGALLMQTFEGFLMLISLTGRIEYVSEKAATHLGLSQVELIGSNIFEFVNAADREELAALLATGKMQSSFPSFVSDYSGSTFNSILRFKCILPKRTSGITFEGYKPIHCVGRVIQRTSPGYSGPMDQAGYSTYMMPPNGTKSPYSMAAATTSAVLLSGSPLPSTLTTEMPLEHNMFIIRTTLDLKFISADSKFPRLLGYESRELSEKSLYEFCHPEDLVRLQRHHRAVFTKGQSTMACYRFYSKSGQWQLLHTTSTMVQSSRSTKPNILVHVSTLIGPDASRDSSKVLISPPHVKNSANNTQVTTILPRPDTVQTTGSTERFFVEPPSPAPQSQTLKMSSMTRSTPSRYHPYSGPQTNWKNSNTPVSSAPCYQRMSMTSTYPSNPTNANYLGSSLDIPGILESFPFMVQTSGSQSQSAQQGMVALNNCDMSSTPSWLQDVVMEDPFGSSLPFDVTPYWDSATSQSKTTPSSCYVDEKNFNTGQLYLPYSQLDCNAGLPSSPHSHYSAASSSSSGEAMLDKVQLMPDNWIRHGSVIYSSGTEPAPII